ncbi:MAG: 2-hydroxyacid dehydrogenase [Dehalococcoidia bacterium]
MARVFLTRTVPGNAVAELEAAGHTVDLWPGELPPPPDALRERLALAAGAMTMVTDRCDAAVFEGCPELRVVANMAVGYDNLDTKAAAARGIWCSNTPGVLAETTADLAWGLLMAAARRIVESDRDTRAGGWKSWSPTGFLGPDVFGSTLGLIGLGEIGTAMARRAAGFSMRILYASRTPKPELEARLGVVPVPLERLLAESDFVSLHCPLTPDTRHLINAATLAQMKPSAILVNTTRGQVVDQDALAGALRAGQIAGAALDVTDPEPLPLSHPLYSFPNVVITPHIGSAGAATRAKMASMAAANIIAVLAGRRPINPINEVAN